MRSTTFKKVALISALFLMVSVAHAQTITYEAAANTAGSLLKIGDYVGAQKSAEKALTLAKTPTQTVEALFGLGLSLNKQKLNDQARKQWMQVFEVLGASAQQKITAEKLLTMSYTEDRNWEQALIEIQKILDSPETTLQIKTTFEMLAAGVLEQQGKIEESDKMLSSIGGDITLDDDSRGGAYFQLATNYARRGKFGESQTALRSELALPKLSPGLAIVARISLADTYTKQGDKAKAQEVYSQAQVAAYELSKALTTQKRYADARAALGSALAVGRYLSAGTPAAFDASMRAEVGHLFIREGNPLEARGTFESLLKKTYPENLSEEDQQSLATVRQGAQLGIAVSYMQQKNRAKAQELLEELLATPALNDAVKVAAEKMLQEVTA